MTVLFYLLGWVVFGIGSLWLSLAIWATVQTAQVGGGGQYAGAGAVIGFLIAGGPAIGVILGGLLILGLGALMARLDRVKRNTADIADAVEDLVRATRDPGATLRR